MHGFIREWIPDEIRNRVSTCSTSAPTQASRSRSAAKTAPSSSSIPSEGTENAAPVKTAAKKRLGNAERIIILANNA